MSFLGKQWIIRREKAENLIEALLENRQIQDAKAFFDHDISRLHDPFLMKGMKEAVERIRFAVQKKEKILIFGDYDVDGISGTAVLYDFLKTVGAEVSYCLPHRERDGYGPKAHLIQQFADQGVKLLITVDCGTSALNEIALANQLGMQVIVTDHHTLPEQLPFAVAILNPHQPDCSYPNKHLSGSGVAFKLVTALAPFYLGAVETAEMLYRQLGIATLGLVADCMPLVGENRILVIHGLKSLEYVEHPGVRSLLESAGAWGKPITTQTVGFIIGPRINAAGRLDSPDHALELLLGKVEKASELESLNRRRQDMVEAFINDAKARVSALPQLPRVIVLHDSVWPAGVLGLIAGKLCEYFGRPVIVMREKETELVGSCRSLNDFDITAFLRSHAAELFAAMGGHAMAGGFTLPKNHLDEFKRRVMEHSANYIDSASFFSKLEIDCLLAPEQLTLETKSAVDRMEPFGYGNPQPTLAIQKARILEIRPVGKTGDHLQLPLLVGGQKIQSIAFRFGEHAEKINLNTFYDIAFHLEINEWNGKKNVQLRVVDMKESE